MEQTMKTPKRDAADAPKAEARVIPTMPTGGTIIPAGPGYTVLTATKGEDGILRFPPPLVVIAWSIGADGIAWPVTALPLSGETIDVGTVHTNGAVVDLDGTVYASQQDWQAALTAKEAAEAEPLGPPVNVDVPLAGQNGTTLTCTMGNWENMQAEPHSYAYQWQRDGANVAGAIAADYVVTPADVDAAMACVVAATNALGTATARSNDVTAAA
jgi:hypothetical protein